jgi:hypothetical protein
MKRMNDPYVLWFCAFYLIGGIAMMATTVGLKPQAARGPKARAKLN